MEGGGGEAGAAPGAARRRAAGALVALGLGLGAAWAFQTLALELGNTLHAAGRFESTKVGLDHGILGAASFMATRTALHGNHLDLGAWHGFHELLLREPVTPERMSLRFRLRDDGWLAAIVQHTGATFEAVRVSREPAAPPACLAGTAEGGFTAKTPLAQPDLDGGWHALSIERAGDHFRVVLDGAEIGACGAPLGRPARVGLRGSGASHIEVDDLRVESSTPPFLVEEDFANHRRAGAIGLAAVGIVAAANALVALASARARRAAGLPLTPYLATANLVLLASGGLALLTDAAYFWRIHPEEVNYEGFQNRIEYVGQIAPRLAKTYPLEPPPPGVRRIVLLGTSQTWGSGAARPEDVWVRRLEAALDASAAPGERFELIDCGLPGETSHELADLWEKRWVKWQPELVLVNLGNNDRDAASMTRELERILALDAERGIRTVFVPEANSIESRTAESLRGLEEKHAAMRELAARRGVPVVEVHAPLVAARDDGFLWWDRVHLTSYGQARLAALLLERRGEWLPPRPGGRG